MVSELGEALLTDFALVTFVVAAMAALFRGRRLDVKRVAVGLALAAGAAVVHGAAAAAACAVYVIVVLMLA